MDTQLIPTPATPLQPYDKTLVPTLFTGAGEQASYRFIEYFTARIRNPNTRQAYFRAVNRRGRYPAGAETTALSPIHAGPRAD
jgi:hypothetical protein